MEGKIYERMANVMQQIEAIGKERKSAAQNFRYRGIDDLYNALQPLLAAQRIWCEPSVSHHVVGDHATKAGAVEHYTQLLVTFRFRTDDGSFVEVGPIPGHGIDARDLGSNKAMSGAQKYALLQAFCIPTELQEDAESHTGPREEYNANNWRGGLQEASKVQTTPLKTAGPTPAGKAPEGPPMKSLPFTPDPKFAPKTQATANPDDTKRAVIGATLKRVANGERMTAEAIVAGVCPGKTNTPQLDSKELERLRVAMAVMELCANSLEKALDVVTLQMELPPFAEMTEEQVAMCWRNVQHVMRSNAPAVEGPGF